MLCHEVRIYLYINEGRGMSAETYTWSFPWCFTVTALYCLDELEYLFGFCSAGYSHGLVIHKTLFSPASCSSQVPLALGLQILLPCVQVLVSLRGSAHGGGCTSAPLGRPAAAASVLIWRLMFVQGFTYHSCQILLRLVEPSQKL